MMLKTNISNYGCSCQESQVELLEVQSRTQSSQMLMLMLQTLKGDIDTASVCIPHVLKLDIVLCLLIICE